jgi:hypothetical protein
MAIPLTEEDIISIYNPISLLNTYNESNKVIPKIIKARHDKRIIDSHIIDPSKFNVIYATSDIHADYSNFINYLKKLNLIKIPDGLNPYSIDIYDHRFITETEWIANNSLFVIIGDIVDGTRNSLNASVPDLRGSFELLLHMFIYNLRIKSWEKGSDILFTIGNHDFLTAIDTNYNDMSRKPWGHYSSYITDEAKQYFKHLKIRKNCLSTFYLLSPYLFLSIQNKRTSILMIHSQIMNDSLLNDSKLDFLTKEQININKNILSMANFNITSLNISEIIQILTARHVENDVDICEHYRQNKDLIPKIIVVGHCPTILTVGDSLLNDKPHIKTIIKDKIGKNEEYEKCNDDLNYGCVIPRCFDNWEDIKIIMVDTGMSSSFRPNFFQPIKQALESERFSEILKIISHGDEGNLDKRFNKLYRLRTDNREIRIKPSSEKDRGSWQEPYIPDSSKTSTSDWPYPLTIDFIEKLFKKDYPKMPADKMEILMDAVKKTDLSSLAPGELIIQHLPKDFWVGSHTFREKYLKYKQKYLKTKNKKN